MIRGFWRINNTIRSVKMTSQKKITRDLSKLIMNIQEDKRSKPRKEACCRCRFWDQETFPESIKLEDDEVSSEMDSRFCKRHPPKIVETLVRIELEKLGPWRKHLESAWELIFEETLTNMGEFVSICPKTQAYDWCGEFVPKE